MRPNLTYVFAKSDLVRAMKLAKSSGHEATAKRLREFIRAHKSRPKLKSIVQRFKGSFVRRGSRDVTVVRSVEGFSTVYAGGKSSPKKKQERRVGF